MKDKIHSKFTSLFGEGGVFYAAAGRINLIGEHTDYNGGYVFPGAIDKGIMAEIKPNGTDKVRLFAIDRDEFAEFSLAEDALPGQHWPRYIYGVCRERWPALMPCLQATCLLAPASVRQLPWRAASRMLLTT